MTRLRDRATLATMSVVDQISVFIENRPGGLHSLAEVLADEGVNIEAVMVPSGTDYGIVHVVVDQHETALQALESHAYRTYTSRVLDMALENEIGALCRLAQRLAEHEVDINYAYSAVAKGRGRLILAVSDVERAAEILEV